MNVKIALAGNPNSGKTTLFNALTGSNQFVGNWPGVTVEKKEGKLKKHDGVVVTDLPGIYSLSPYTLEEVIARNYLINEKPDVILNIIDATNLERNLYLTTQLTELGIPVVIALNMMDVIAKNGDKIDVKALSKSLGCKIVEISALKGTGIEQAAEEALKAAKEGKSVSLNVFSDSVESAIAHIEEIAGDNLPQERKRWYAIKIFEHDEKVMQSINISSETMKLVEEDISKAEKQFDDDAESVITNERYEFIANTLKGCYKKRKTGMTTSDKIDRIVTNRWLALPIFAVIMFCVYFISVTTVGGILTDWMNDGVFGDGWHLFGIGASAYEEVVEDFSDADTVLNAFLDYSEENGGDIAEIREMLDADDVDADALNVKLNAFASGFASDFEIEYEVENEETLVTEIESATGADLVESIKVLYEKYGFGEPDASDYGVWVPGIPVLVESGLDAINCADWLKGLILDGIIAGVGAVLGFVPQILVLFIFLAFLEACGYMSRIAFVLDRIFRKFGLSGKSFIPMLIGSGCGIPGIMASRTIENERDRRMTVITTTFIPCGAKLPFIAMIAGVIFGGAWWVAPSAYFMGIFAVIISGIMLKKTKLFSGDPAPFVMELPAYHWPTFGNVMRSMWERGWSFIKKAGTIILLSTIVIWFTSRFGFSDGSFGMLAEEEMGGSILAYIGNAIAWIFTPLGFGNWQAAVASITGIVAKENIVGTLGILYGSGAGMAETFTQVSAYSFLAFNLLCAPCFAAIGAIRREMNSAKWTWFAIGYQCGFAYVIAFIVNNLGNLFAGTVSGALGVIGVILAFVALAALVYMLVRPDKKSDKHAVKNNA